jgi:hypothetical protein
MHPNENRDLASGRDARYRERKRGGENPFLSNPILSHSFLLG